MQSSASKLLTNAETLDLDLAVLDALHQEADSLGANILVGLSVGRQFVHEHDKVLEVDVQQGGVTAKKGLEDLEGLHDLVILTLVNGVLEHSNHRGNHVLECLDGAGVKLRLNVHGKLAQSEQGVDPNLGALGIADGLAKQSEKILELLLEGLAQSLEDGEEDVDGNSTLILVTAVGSPEEDVGEIAPLTIVQINLSDSGDDASNGVTDKRGALTHGRAEQLLADLGFLLIAHLQPVFRNEGSGLDSGELTKVGVIVSGGDLNEEDKRLRLAVEFLLQDAGRFLNIALGGWKARVS